MPDLARTSMRLALLGLALLALTAAWVLPARARNAFQSSPPPTPARPFNQSVLASPTLFPSVTPRPTLRLPAAGLPTQTPAAAGPASQAAPAAVAPATPTLTAPQLTATAVALSYLPAPTLTSPGVPPQIALAPDARPPLSGPAQNTDPQNEPTAQGDTGAATLPQMIDSGVRLFSYAWLCCGVVVLISATLGAVWLLRRYHPEHGPQA